jgi:hypothetical protein
MDQDLFSLETLTDVIAHSQIVVENAAGRAVRLPTGFDATDVAILDWIVAEGRRVGCGLVQM